MAVILDHAGPREVLGDVGLGGKYLTFRIGKEDYGIAIRHVHEIIGTMSVAHIPRAPEYVRGIINLRGKIIPIIDLRLRMAMEAKQDTEKSCVIVVDVQGPKGSVTMGFVADEVSEVLDIAASDIEDAPAFGAGLDTAFILGIAKMKSSVKILIDINRVLGGSEIVQLQEIA